MRKALVPAAALLLILTGCTPVPPEEIALRHCVQLTVEEFDFTQDEAREVCTELQAEDPEKFLEVHGD